MVNMIDKALTDKIHLAEGIRSEGIFNIPSKKEKIGYLENDNHQ